MKKPILSGIYKITNIVSGEIYIGSAVNLDQRWREHKSRLKTGVHGNYKLKRDYMRHGIEVFLFEIIETVDCIENLLEREQFYIDFLKPQYNISPVVTNPMSGRQHTEESKKKMSESHKGQVPWNTGIIGYNSGDKNPMYGKHWSEEHKKAQAKKLAGSNSPNATITEEIVLQIKLMILHGDKQKNIANFFGISEQIVSKIHTGRSWRHVTLNNTEGDKIYATPQ